MSECKTCCGSGWIEYGEFGGDCAAIHGMGGRMPDAPGRSRCDDCGGTGLVVDELTEAYAEGRADEREQWLPLAATLREHILNRHQVNGSLTLSLEDVLAISAALAAAEGRP